jgi:hypothetical protein
MRDVTRPDKRSARLRCAYRRGKSATKLSANATNCLTPAYADSEMNVAVTAFVDKIGSLE